jgi:hypothetical protein
MNPTGRFDGNGKLIAHGSFRVKGEPDSGWRIEVHTGDELIINMFCINPANGNEEGWVWLRFTRSLVE